MISEKQWAKARQVIVGHSFSSKVVSTFGAQLLTLTFGLAHSAIVARSLGPEGKGILSVALLVPQMLMLLLSMGINLSNVYFSATKKYDASQLGANTVGLALFIVIIAFGIVAVGFVSGLIKKFVPGVPAHILLLFILSFPLTLLIHLLEGILQGSRRILEINIISVIQILSLVTLDILFIVVLDAGIKGAVAAFIVSYIIRFVYVVVCLRQKENASFLPRWDKNVIRETLSYGLRGYIGNLFQFFNYRLDTFLVNYYLTSADIGIYSISVMLGELLWNFPKSIAFVMFPKAAETGAKEIRNFTPRVFFITLGVNILGAIGLVLTGKYLIPVIFGIDFIDAYGPLVILTVGIVLMGSTKVLSSQILGLGYPQYNSIATGLGLMITIGLDLWLIPRYGVHGAALASTIAYSVISFVIAGFYLKVSKK